MWAGLGQACAGFPTAISSTTTSTVCRILGIPFSATMKTRAPPYVTDSMSAEEKTAALQRAKKDAYQAAKETYKKNHVDKNPRPDVSVPSDRSTTRAEWDRAYRDIRVKTNSQEQIKIAQQNQQKASKVSAQYGYDKKPGKKNSCV